MKKQRLWSLLTVLDPVALTSYLHLTLGGHGAAQPLRTTMTPLFAPVDITTDLSALSATEQRALARIVDASRVMDGLFLEQV